MHEGRISRFIKKDGVISQSIPSISALLVAEMISADVAAAVVTVVWQLMLLMCCVICLGIIIIMIHDLMALLPDSYPLVVPNLLPDVRACIIAAALLALVEFAGTMNDACVGVGSNFDANELQVEAINFKDIALFTSPTWSYV